MGQFIYYHNPRCSKSRQGLAILEDNKVDFRIKEYLKEPLKQNELKELAAKLKNGTLPLRKGEAVYKEMKLGKLE
jgi:arsenate reductase